LPTAPCTHGARMPTGNWVRRTALKRLSIAGGRGGNRIGRAISYRNRRVLGEYSAGHGEYWVSTLQAMVIARSARIPSEWLPWATRKPRLFHADIPTRWCDRRPLLRRTVALALACPANIAWRKARNDGLGVAH
jgi:hypothetical protein